MSQLVTTSPRFIELDKNHYNLNLLVAYNYNESGFLVMKFIGSEPFSIKDPGQFWYNKLIDSTH